MKILSLFDWIACWYEALQRAWIHIDKYYASEIDKYAIQIAKKNHSDIIEIWSVEEIQWKDFSDVDMIIWWSPCQWFSRAWKMLNFEDPRSKLFFEFVRLVKEIKPKYFLLENVKMKKEYEDIISEQLGVKPIEINSALVSGQNRKRLYRTNIEWVEQPKDKWIYLKDILIADEWNEWLPNCFIWKQWMQNKTSDKKMIYCCQWMRLNLFVIPEKQDKTLTCDKVKIKHIGDMMRLCGLSQLKN